MRTQLKVADASCDHCKSTIEGAPSTLDGVTDARLDLETKLVDIWHDSSTVSADLVTAIEGVGYAPEEAK